MAKKATTKKAAPKRQVTATSDQAPEAKRSTKAQQDAAEKLFEGADGVARNLEQHENHVRRQALGY